MEPKLIRIDVSKGDSGLFFVTSPDHKGLIVTGSTSEEAVDGVPAALVDLYMAAGERVVVARSGDHFEVRESAQA